MIFFHFLKTNDNCQDPDTIQNKLALWIKNYFLFRFKTLLNWKKHEMKGYISAGGVTSLQKGVTSLKKGVQLSANGGYLSANGGHLSNAVIGYPFAGGLPLRKG